MVVVMMRSSCPPCDIDRDTVADHAVGIAGSACEREGIGHALGPGILAHRVGPDALMEAPVDHTAGGDILGVVGHAGGHQIEEGGI